MHTSHNSGETLQEIDEMGIEILDCIPKGCDLSPIEQVWAKLKDNLYEKRQFLKNKKDVWRYSKEYFYSDAMNSFV